RRDHCMAEIAGFWSGSRNSGGLFEKARLLLTRHWSVSPWRGRADILRTAEWLVGIGKKGAGAPQTCEGYEGGRICLTRGGQRCSVLPMTGPLIILLDVIPVLAMALVIVCIPLLCDGPPQRRQVGN